MAEGEKKTEKERGPGIVVFLGEGARTREYEDFGATRVGGTRDGERETAGRRSEERARATEQQRAGAEKKRKN